MRQRLLALLDVIALVKAVRVGVGGMDRASALVVMILSFLGALVSGGYTWVADWLPTWRFANGEPPAGYGYSPDNVAQALISSADGFAGGVATLPSMTLASFIGATIAVGITLFPTVIQFIAPRVVHPAATTAADIAIWFDFITDFPAAWAQAGGVTDNVLGRLPITLVLVLIYSLLLQTLFVLFLAAFVSALIVLLRGEPRRATVIDGGADPFRVRM